MDISRENLVDIMSDQIDELLPLFDYEHLPPKLQDTSKHFHDLAHNMVMDNPVSWEMISALRKILEAKDCTIRAVHVVVEQG